MNLNQVSIIGRVGKNPEIRTMQNGKQVASFTVACTEKYKDKNGERKEKTEWIPIVIFSENLVKLAENYITKGTLLYLQGKYTTRKWQDKDGHDKYTTEVVLQGYDAVIRLLSGKVENNDAPQTSNNDAAETAVELDDEVPFNAVGQCRR